MNDISSHQIIPPLQDVKEFRKSLDRETDRGCAVMSAAYLDVALENLLKASFVQADRVIKETFNGTGPLATFSSRINLSFLLGLIDEQIFRDLNIIRKIRNDFAHEPTTLLFSSESVFSRCIALECYGQSNIEGRKKFTSVILGLLGLIHKATDLSNRPATPLPIDFEKFRELLDNLACD